MARYRLQQDDPDTWRVMDNATQTDQTFTGPGAEADARRWLLMTARQSGAQAWEAGIRTVIEDQGRTLIRSVMALSIDAQANGITDLIADTPADAQLEGTTILKEDAAALNNMMNDLMVFLSGHATGAPEGVTRQTLIFRKF